MSDEQRHRGRDEVPGDGGARPGRGRRRRVLPALLAGLLALSLLSAMAAPLLLERSSTDSDDEAKGLLFAASSEMDSCAAQAGGSYGGCDAERMRDIVPEMEWREGAAPYGKGWGDGRVGRVYVSTNPENPGFYRLETTSGSGWVFAYEYSGGSVTKTAKGSSEPEPW